VEDLACEDDYGDEEALSKKYSCFKDEFGVVLNVMIFLIILVCLLPFLLSFNIHRNQNGDPNPNEHGFFHSSRMYDLREEEFQEIH
jgi:hypothetical protein